MEGRLVGAQRAFPVIVQSSMEQLDALICGVVKFARSLEQDEL